MVREAVIRVKNIPIDCLGRTDQTAQALEEWLNRQRLDGLMLIAIVGTAAVFETVAP